MSRKVSIVLFLCVMLVMTSFAGCGTAAGDASKAAATAAQASTQAPAPAKAQVVSIVMERPLFGEAPDPTNPPNMRIRQKFKDILGIDVEIVGDLNPDDQNVKPNLMIAAGEKLDIFQTNHNPGLDWRKYKKEGTIIPLNDLLDKYGTNLKAHIDPNSFKQLTDEDGKVWGLPDEANPVTTSLLVRSDWLKADNLSVPVTVEDFEKMWQTFKDKQNDVGWMPGWPALLEGTFAGTFIKTGDQNFVDTDGKLKPWYCSPQAKDFLAKMQEWYKKGYIVKEAASLGNQQFNDLMFGGKAGTGSMWTSNNMQQNVDMLKASVPEGELQVIAPPKGPQGGLIDAYLPTSCDIMITKSSQNPDAAMKFLDYSQGTDEGYLLAKYGEEGTDFTWVDKANRIVKLTDKKPGVDRYGYPIFCSVRLNYFAGRFSSSKVNTDTTAFMLDKTKYPSALTVDAFVNYDINSMKSKDQLNSLGTFISENEWKVVMGQIPVSEWDNIIKKWLSLGGQQMIDDYTAQFNAQTKK